MSCEGLILRLIIAESCGYVGETLVSIPGFDAGRMSCFLGGLYTDPIYSLADVSSTSDAVSLDSSLVGREKTVIASKDVLSFPNG